MIPIFQSVSQFVDFLKEWVNSGGQLVDQNTANTRAEICAGCHNNLASTEVRKTCCGGGAASNAALWVARHMIIQNKTTPMDKQLLVCGLCGCDLKIKVWAPLQALKQTKEDANAWPTFCWCKKVLEDKEV